MDLQLLIKVKIYAFNVTGCRIFNFCKNGSFRGTIYQKCDSIYQKKGLAGEGLTVY